MDDVQLLAWRELLEARTKERDIAHGEILHLQNQYTHQHAIAQEQLTRAEAAEAEVVRLREQVAALRYTLNVVINGDGNHLTTGAIDMALDALEATA